MSDDPIRVGHPDAPVGGMCGCCDGVTMATVRPTVNRPALAAISFRVGDHAAFKASMLAGLSQADRPALRRLGTRADDDFSIALMDGWASVCDVLTFYQERLANEAYMGTATERGAIRALAELIGYRLHPGAAAETDLVILMDDPPGATPDVTDLQVPDGVRVQSQPGPDEQAQVFETIAPLTARVAWNALRPRLSRRIAPAKGHLGTWLQGTPALQVGDAVLIVGRDRAEADPGSELWDFRRVTSVQPDATLGRTWVAWDIPLGSENPPGEPAQIDHRFFLLRDRASLFGHNAPHPAVLSKDQRTIFGPKPAGGEIAAPAEGAPSPSHFEGTVDAPGDWVFQPINGGVLRLDQIYKSFVSGSWAALTLPDGLVELYRITDAGDDALSAYAISGKATRLELDTTESLSTFADDYRKVSVYGGSEEIALAETPERGWVAGQMIELETAPDLPPARRLIFRGRRARLEVRAKVLSILADDGALRGVGRGNRVTLMTAPEDLPGGGWRMRLADSDGFEGISDVGAEDVVSVPAQDDVEQIAEVAELRTMIATDATHAAADLIVPLANSYDRTSLIVHANVVRAAHGEGATEIMGSGDPARPFQKFLLKQAPVTHRLAATETGIASSLTVRVEGVAWTEMPDLFERGPRARVYRTRLTDAGETIVEFGDGISGERPGAGRDNLVAEYSRGLGRAGNLKAGQLSLPIDRPLGLRDTVNPLPATGGADPEASEDARRNAPIHTLTLGRVVSISDYRDFALGFPGIAKAEAGWVWQGEARRIVVTVAGEDGDELPPGSTTHDTLLDAFRGLGDPLVEVELLSWRPAFFRIGLRVAVDPAHVLVGVLTAVEDAMHAAFGFDARSFAMPVALSEVARVAHDVAGVVAVDVDLLHRETGAQSSATAFARLTPNPAELVGGVLRGAEILSLRPGPLSKLEEMT